MIFDTHAHYDDRAFDADRDELLLSMKARGVGRIVNVTSNMESVGRSIRIAEEYPFIYSSVGLHPTEIYDLTTDVLTQIEPLCDHKKVVAIGEIGLDYHYPDTNEKIQKEFFEAQLDMAARHGLPVIVHSRDAASDTMEIMRAHNAGDIGGVVHCYSYSPEMAKQYVDMGLFIGVGGVVTYKNGRKLKECVRELPIENIVIETDCPYLSPEPKRGERNNSLNLFYVVETIAQLRGITPAEVIKITSENACRLYRMNPEEELTDE